MLKLNDEQIKVLVISTPSFTDRLHETQLTIGDAGVQDIESGHNISMIFDNNLDMSNRIKSVCRATETSDSPRTP